MRAFIVDSGDGGADAAIRILDLPSGRTSGILPAGYLPEAALSADGRRLFVADTTVDRARGRNVEDTLLVLDADSSETLSRGTLHDRFLYNVAPNACGLVPSADGNWCAVLKARIIGDGIAEYSLAVFDSAAGQFRPREIRLPECAVNLGLLPGRARIHAVLAGREMECVGIVDLEAGTPFQPLFERPGEAAGDLEACLVGSTADVSGRVQFVTRSGFVYTCDCDARRVSEPVRVSTPDGVTIPLQQVFTSGSRLFLGMADRERASRGQVDRVAVYDQSGGLFHLFTWHLPHPVEKLALSRDQSILAGLDRTTRRLFLMDAASGRLLAEIAEVGRSPVAMAVG